MSALSHFSLNRADWIEYQRAQKSNIQVLLTSGCPATTVNHQVPLRVTSNVTDIDSGALFIAIKGARFDGHMALDEAVQRGACLIAVEDRELAVNWLKLANDRGSIGHVELLCVPSTRKLLAELAHVAFQRTSTKLFAIGVTGTNGKTTTTFMIEHILNRLEIPTGLMGTIQHRLGDRAWKTALTTPGPIEYHSRLNEFFQNGAKAVALEVSSHSIDQNRVAGTEFDCAVWTSFSHDHLDYHGTVDRYFTAKTELFTVMLAYSTKAKKRAVINTSVFSSAMSMGVEAQLVDQFCSWCIHDAKTKGIDVLFYGPNKQVAETQWASDPTTETAATYSIVGTNRDGMSVLLKISGQFPMGGDGDSSVDGVEFQLPMIGHYNAENAVAAVLVAQGFGISLRFAAQALSDFAGVPGRVERVRADLAGNTDASNRWVDLEQKLPIVFVDFAHTDDGLFNVLTAIGEYAGQLTPKPRIITVFGCGGDRDRTKRPKMGRVAGQLSDHVVVTSDNPRSENPMAIIQDILAGTVSSRASVDVEPDRAQAIELAIKRARASDIVLIAGKGHETTQTIGEQVITFSDGLVAKAVLQKLSQADEAEDYGN